MFLVAEQFYILKADTLIKQKSTEIWIYGSEDTLIHAHLFYPQKGMALSFSF